MTTAPPYTITPAILDLSIRIGEAIGRAEEAAVGENLRLWKSWPRSDCRTARPSATTTSVRHWRRDWSK